MDLLRESIAAEEQSGGGCILFYRVPLRKSEVDPKWFTGHSYRFLLGRLVCCHSVFDLPELNMRVLGLPAIRVFWSYIIPSWSLPC